MSDVTTERLVATYIKIRDKRDELSQQYKAEDAKLEEKMDLIKKALLGTLNEAGADSLKTPEGSVRKTLKKKFWTSDWDQFYAYVNRHQAPHLMEARIHQTNLREFLESHPSDFPIGLNQETEFAVTVTRPRNSK